MNIFLSNFSEAGLANFDEGNYELRDVIAWTVIWTKIKLEKAYLGYAVVRVEGSGYKLEHLEAKY